MTRLQSPLTPGHLPWLLETRCLLTSFLLLQFVAVSGHVFAETGVKAAKPFIRPPFESTKIRNCHAFC